VSRTTCTADRRVVRIALTDGGRSLIDRPWDARRLLLTELLANASDADRQHVTTGLETLCRLLDGAPQPARPNEKIAEDGT
jgi:DNA-binding MarR family transcriptional regulator